MIAGTLVVLSIVGLLFSGTGGVTVQVSEASLGEIQEYVDERGQTHLPVEYKISIPFSGRVDEITLVEGAAVSQGQIVAKMAEKDLTNELDEAEAVVARLDALIRESNDDRIEQMTKLQADEFVVSMRNTVEAAKERVLAGEERFGYATRVLDRILQLRATSVASQDLEDEKRLKKVEAEIAFRQDKLVLGALQAISSATSHLPKMASDFIQRKGLKTAVLQKQRDEAHAQLQMTLVKQQRGSMASPVNGIVLSRPQQNEQFLTAGSVLMTIGDLNQLEIETELLSQEVIDVKKGNLVEIYGPAVGASLGEGVEGTVARVFPAGFSKVSSLGVEQQRVKVIIKLSESARARLNENNVGVGYRVRARIFTQQKEEALIIPRTAIFRGPDNQWQVFVVERGRLKLTTLSIGLSNDNWVEVIDGITEGDQVVLAPENSLAAGVRAHPLLH